VTYYHRFYGNWSHFLGKHGREWSDDAREQNGRKRKRYFIETSIDEDMGVNLNSKVSNNSKENATEIQDTEKEGHSDRHHIFVLCSVITMPFCREFCCVEFGRLSKEDCNQEEDFR
jgi:hypothetical protein